MTHSRFLRASAGSLLALQLAGLAAILAAPSEAHAQNIIKQPGNHNQYSFEIEPHLVTNFGWGWSGRAGNGFYAGPGVRASIPFMHNGPIDTINNNIGISFGIDTFFPNGTAAVQLPVAFQWNFYFTDIISVIGEAGLVPYFFDCPGGCGGVDPLFQGGGRFQFGKVGVLVRIGYPTASVGANFQF